MLIGKLTANPMAREKSQIFRKRGLELALTKVMAKDMKKDITKDIISANTNE
jgi:hypothetical protein